MKKLLSLLLVGVFGFFLVGCGNGADEADYEPTEEAAYEADEAAEAVALGELTIGLMPALDSFPVIIAYKRGYFETEGLTVNLEPFSSPGDRDAAMAAGQLDATLFDLVAVALALEADIVPLRAVTATTGRFTLIAAEGYETIEDLAGATVVISENTAIDFTLDEMIKAAGFGADHIETLSIPAIPTRLEYVREGNAEAVLLPEPWATIGLMDGLNNITDSVILDVHSFLIAFTDDAIENSPAEIEAFLAAYNRGVDFLNSADLDEFFHYMVDVIGFPEHVGAYLEMPTFRHHAAPETETVEAVIAWLEARGLVTEGFTVADFVR